MDDFILEKDLFFCGKMIMEKIVLKNFKGEAI